MSGEDLIAMAQQGARLVALGEAMVLFAAGRFALQRESEAADELRRIRSSGGRPLWNEYDAHLWAADELAAALTIPSVTAGRRLDDGERLVTQMPRLLAALASGTVDIPRVQAVLKGTTDLDGATASAVCNAVLPAAGDRTAAELGRMVRREVVRRAPHVADQAFDRAKRRRSAEVYADDVAGMACLRVTGPADRIALAWQAATALAKDKVDRSTGDDEPLTLDQARADAVLDLVIGLGGGAPGEDPGTSAALASHTALHVSFVVPPGGAVELAGHGPLPPSAVPAQVNAWTVNPRGAVTATQSVPAPGRGYVPPPRLAATVRARDTTCRFPGCARQAARCDLDHVVPWPSGPTSYDNLAALCRRHHRLKTHGRWRVDKGPDQVLTWTSPTGSTYVTEPPDWLGAAPDVVPQPAPAEPVPAPF